MPCYGICSRTCEKKRVNYRLFYLVIIYPMMKKLFAVLSIACCISTAHFQACNPCHNGAVFSVSGSTFSCTSCPAGFEGTFCETNINECATNPCLNGGQCIDGINSYTCNCKPNYSGSNCATPFDACSPNPCENGGQCTADTSPSGFTCNCASGFAGDTCQTATCLNDGGCQGRVNGHYQSCRSCNEFVICSHGTTHFMSCGANTLVWDNTKKVCTFSSTTCQP